MTTDIRWQQRFDNFQKSYGLLEQAVAISNPSEVEQAGLLQFFEMSIELAWKILKDYLLAEKYQVNSPRETIKLALQVGLIVEGETWLKALDDRNLISHVYDQKTSQEITTRIKNTYFQLLKNFHQAMQQKYV